jgi:uncharacterized protein (TIGR03067 family)
MTEWCTARSMCGSSGGGFRKTIESKEAVMRRILPLFALACFGFAPAPRYRPAADRFSIDLGRFEGVWKVIGHTYRVGGVRMDNRWEVTHIRVQKDRWTLWTGEQQNATYRIAIGEGTRPRHIDWYGETGETLWRGVIRRDGDRVDITYKPVASGSPLTFEAHSPDHVRIALRRER